MRDYPGTPESFVEARKKYPKLVRDRMPAIIRGHGHTAITRTVEGAELVEFLIKKMHEEIDEVAAAITQEERVAELADACEVLHALYRALDVLMSDVGIQRYKKAERCGAFERGLVLVDAFPTEGRDSQ